MKVLHVEAGRHLYGGALQVVFLMRGLAQRGVHVALACPQGSAIAAAVRELGLPVHEMPMRGDADIGLVGRLRQLMREMEPDVLHLHSRRGCDTWGALAGRLHGVPTVLSRRVDNPESKLWAALKYRLPDHVVTISQGIREVLLREGVPEVRITCVPSAVDTAQYRPGRGELRWFREEFKLSDESLVIGMAAQFIERKGHVTLLDALPAVFARHPEARVLLLGQGPLVESIQQRVAADPVLAGRVQLTGFRRDLDRVLPCLDVLAHPAYMEGLGVALLQAAACGVPIVGGRTGGIPEIVQPGLNGELIEPGDVAALAGALNDLLDSGERRVRMGAAGRLWVEKQFSIDAMVEGNLAVYLRQTKKR
ncbi:MAG TPA: glycosyltransferase [Ideonella sp.]|uniref:glycosyltransferase n=1 Tax=Ideonella sp. TaxID=1929293 RepID=UPI002E345023|nr:glycosyltransferase [Ideonella sp.]HEX5683901.1 glycosyltransferase [Ideonella sp.]